MSQFETDQALHKFSIRFVVLLGICQQERLLKSLKRGAAAMWLSGVKEFSKPDEYIIAAPRFFLVIYTAYSETNRIFLLKRSHKYYQI